MLAQVFAQVLAYVEPSSATAIAILGVCLVLVFTFEAANRFHEIADAVATVIHSRAMRPMPAMIRSGLINIVGVLAGGIAAACAGAAGRAVGARQFPRYDQAGRPVRVGLLPRFGIPNASSYCIIGALAGLAPAIVMRVFAAVPGDEGANRLGSRCWC